jgi:hypothetical protein
MGRTLVGVDQWVQSGLLSDYFQQVFDFGSFVKKPVRTQCQTMLAVKRLGVNGQYGDPRRGCELFELVDDVQPYAVWQVQIQNNQSRWIMPYAVQRLAERGSLTDGCNALHATQQSPQASANQFRIINNEQVAGHAPILTNPVLSRHQARLILRKPRLTRCGASHTRQVVFSG